MNVRKNIIKLFKNDSIAPVLIALILSTLLIGYALSSILIGILTLYSVLSSIYSRKKLELNVQLLLPIILYLFMCTTYFWSVDKALSLKGIGRLLSLIIVPITFVLLPKLKKEDLKFILKVFTNANILLSLFFLVTSFMRYIATRSLNEFTYHRLVSNLDLNAIYVSMYFVISLSYVLFKKNKQKRHFLMILFFIVMLFLLSSKIVIGISLISLLLFFILNSGYGIKIKQKVALLAFTLVVISILFPSQIVTRFKDEKTINVDEVLNNKTFGQIYPWTGTSIRLLQLRVLSEQIHEKKIFWTGFGLFASRKSLDEYHTKYNTYRAFHNYNYHNMYAQIFSETGFFGLLLLVLLLLINFINALKSRSFIFILFSISMPIWFITESVLWVQRGVLFFIVFYCLFNCIDLRIKNTITNS